MSRLKSNHASLSRLKSNQNLLKLPEQNYKHFNYTIKKRNQQKNYVMIFFFKLLFSFFSRPTSRLN